MRKSARREETPRSNVTPDETGPNRRTRSRRESGQPADRRPGESSREQLRVTGEQGAVRARRSDDPATGDKVAAFPPERRRQVFGFRQLAIGGSHRGSHIAERIPGLDKDQPSQPVASESDITRSIWIGRPSRKLEDPLEARLATRPQDELLNRKMARIANVGQRITTKFQSKGKVEGGSDTLPGIHGQPATQAELQPADRCLGKPDERAECRLSQPAPLPGGADFAAETGELLAVSTDSFHGQDGAPELRHSNCMIAEGASLAITSVWQVGCGG